MPAALMRGEVGAGEVFLAEMDVVAAEFDCEAPKIVDDQLGAVGFAEVAGFRDLGAQVGLGHVFRAQLREFCAAGQQAAQPSHVIDDEVERVELHVQSHVNARPSTGVEGSAMSRGSMGRAL